MLDTCPHEDCFSTGDQLPRVQVYHYDDWPESHEGQQEMEFRLVYQGPLPAASGNTRTKIKHHIRKALHPQLKELWYADRFLRKYYMTLEDDGHRRFERLADKYKICGDPFLPLVGTAAGDEACALDILFLRRDHPGDLIKHGGDLDNRMKVLLDALRIPIECQEVCGEKPTADEDPFFCLLQDDRLITELRIVTDRLLTPSGSPHGS
jgi:hypothetical protein